LLHFAILPTRASFQHESTRLSVYKSIKQLVVSLIEVFVHSHSKDIDVGHYREMSYHWQCGLAQWAYGELAGQFKGRILCEEDVGVLRQVLEMAKKEGLEVKVYDTSRMGDRMKALRHGILQTPAAIMNGELYQGLNEISQVIASKPNP
jgi:hypothetical protein